MPIRSCYIDSCSIPAERSIGSCMLCGKHFCIDHIRSKSHPCPSSETESEAYDSAYTAARSRYLAALLAKIDAEALRLVAVRARGGGIHCEIPALDNTFDDAADRLAFVADQCGGQNCNLDIRFDDGTVWIARIRLDDPTLPPSSIQAQILLSEVATLKFLGDTKVPVPQIYAHALESSDNPVGVSYILMEKITGSPLDWNDATPEQREHVMEQLADVFLELERHPFPLTGSLSLQTPSDPAKADERSVGVGSFTQLAWFENSEKGLGPLASAESAYKAVIRLQMQALADHELSSLPVDNYLTLLWQLQNVPNLTAKSVSQAERFYLKHFDDKGDHILVDENHNITSIIDWEFASTESKELAFSSPCMMWPVGRFYDGDNKLADDELKFAGMFDARGRKDMGDIVRAGRRWQRFLFFLGSLPQEYDELELLFQGVLESCAADEQRSLSYAEWKASFLPAVESGDAELQALLRYERN